MRTTLLSTIAMLVAWAGPALAEAPTPRNVSVDLYWENDSVFFKPNHPTDRWYTNGVGFSVLWDDPQVTDQVNDVPWLTLLGEVDRAPVGFTVGQLMFTPDDITQPSLIRNERPYAGYLYAAGILQLVRGNSVDHFQVEIGQTGDASLGEDAQQAVHDLIGDDEPRGWSNQVDDELQVQLYARKRWRLDVDQWTHEDGSDSLWGIQVLPEIGGALGTVYGHVEAGAIARAGWRLPDDFGPSRLQNIAPPATYQEGWSVYGFARGTARLTAHNLFVEGSYSRGGHGVEQKNLVGELQVGLNLAYTVHDWAFELGYSQTYTTPEYEGQPVWHGHGAWTVSLQHWF